MYFHVFGYAEQDAAIHFALSQVLLEKIFSSYFSEILNFGALAAPLNEVGKFFLKIKTSLRTPNATGKRPV